MSEKEKLINPSSICAISEDIVARRIEDELIIVPISSGIGDMEDELYTLNETGIAIWEKIDGERTFEQIIGTLAEEYDAPREKIERDVLGLVTELIRRKMLVILS